MKNLAVAGAFDVKISITNLVTQSPKHIVVLFPTFFLLDIMQESHFLIQHLNNCLQMQIVQSFLQKLCLKIHIQGEKIKFRC